MKDFTREIEMAAGDRSFNIVSFIFMIGYLYATGFLGKFFKHMKKWIARKKNHD
jgi:hypothetical protein